MKQPPERANPPEASAPFPAPRRPHAARPGRVLNGMLDLIRNTPEANAGAFGDWSARRTCEGHGLRLDAPPEVGDGSFEFVEIEPGVLMIIRRGAFKQPLEFGGRYDGSVYVTVVTEGAYVARTTDGRAFRIAGPCGLGVRHASNMTGYATIEQDRPFTSVTIMAGTLEQLFTRPMTLRPARAPILESLDGKVDEVSGVVTEATRAAVRTVQDIVECTYDEPLRRQLLTLKAKELLCHLAASRVVGTGYPALRRSSLRDGGDVARSVKLLVEQDLDQRLSIEAMARRLGVSANKCMRDFKAEYGISIQAYGKAIRLKHAEHLLRTSSLSVTEIAAEAGYDSLSSFISAFTARFGASPSKVRARH